MNNLQKLQQFIDNDMNVINVNKDNPHTQQEWFQQLCLGELMAYKSVSDQIKVLQDEEPKWKFGRPTSEELGGGRLYWVFLGFVDLSYVFMWNDLMGWQDGDGFRDLPEQFWYMEASKPEAPNE